MIIKRATSFFSDFKDFLNRGNAVDLAVAVVIGAAFSKVVNSLVADVFMPFIGYFIDGIDFSNLEWVLKKGREGVEPISVKYGLFINTIISFVIISFVIFLVIKLMGKLKRAKEAEVTTQKCGQCGMDIPLNVNRCGHCTQPV